MAAPWGDSRYPPFPTAYMHSGPPRNARQQQPRPHVPQAAPGFYNPAVFPNQPYGPPPAGPPPPIVPPVPTVLKPGRGPFKPPLTTQRSYSKELSGDIFFGAPSFPHPQINTPPAPLYPPPPHLHRPPPQIRHTVSAPAPPPPQKSDLILPPLPPKPTHDGLPHAGPSSHSGSYPRPGTRSTRQEPPRLPPKLVTEPLRDGHKSDAAAQMADLEAQELERALRLSALDAEAAKKREEEELAHALQESLHVASPLQISTSTPSFATQVEQSTTTSSSQIYGLSLPSASPASSYSPLPSPSYHRSSVSLPAVDLSNEPRFTDSSTWANSPPSSCQQIHDDEAFARRLIQQDQLAVQRRESTTAPPGPMPANNHVRPEPQLPRYDDIVAGPRPPSAATSRSAPATTHTSPNLAALPPPIPHTSIRQPSPASSGSSTPSLYIGRSTSANAVPTLLSTAAHQPETRSGRSQSFGAYRGGSAARPPMLESSSDPGHPQSHLAQPPKTVPLPVVVETSQENGPSRPTSLPSVPLNTNQFIDNELLRGVTIGFSPPVMTTELKPMKGPIPNVIGLPYGRAPPLHFKAPNWHDMLMLMARMSGTRLEATVEAMAVVKTAMQLRVVVNFVKIHQSSPDWHVILYMTIDMPVPQDHRYKYRNSSDPALLPYSYSLSPTPAYLRESADGPMSKWYTVPSTAANPYPTLPITFPDVATYLMSALENSRRSAHDRSSGWYRLAKHVDTFYPMPTAADDEGEERSRLSERFGRFFGRGSKTPRHDNDERSNLVTPFFADEFGR